MRGRVSVCPVCVLPWRCGSLCVACERGEGKGKRKEKW